MRNKEEVLKTIQMENYIWIVYLILIGLSFLANKEEVKYFLYGDKIAKKNYRTLLIIVFSIAVVIYYYFFKSGLAEYKNIKIDDTCSKKFFETINFIATILVLISGIIFLFIAIFDEHVETEIAF